MGEKVTISDCGKALDELEYQIKLLTLERANIDRKIAALRTQGMLINALVKMI